MNDSPYGQRLLPQVVDEAAKQAPSRTIGMIANHDNSERFQVLSVGQLANAVNFTAYWIEKQIGRARHFETIAYIGTGDFRYWVMELAAMKCGYTILLPSARNSDVNNISLFSELKCMSAFYTSPFKSKVTALLPIKVHGFLIPTFEEMIGGQASTYPYNKTWEEARLDPVVICHTSGSTGAPKPVIYNHTYIGVMDSSRMIPGDNGRPDGNISILEGATYFLGFPAFHLMGIVYGLCSLFYKCVPVLPPQGLPPNGEVIVDIMGKIELSHIICPPILFDDLVKNFRQDFISRSGSLIYVHNAGGPLSKDTGNFLSSKFGLIQIIGSTETAKLPCLVARGEDWEWYEWNPHVGGVRMEKLDGSLDVYELIVERVPGQEWAQPIFHAFPHLNVWRTRDLYRKHPTRNLWIFDGRKDDVIVLNNGEKFNPVSMEAMISSHSLVKGALVVGNSCDQVGLLLETDEPRDDFAEKVWPTVQKANLEAPQHARVYKHMIATSNPEKPFHRAAKGTIQRFVTTNDYKDEIEAMYSNNNTARAQQVSENLPRLDLSKSVLLDFIHQSVKFQLDRDDFANSDDLFFLGFDSLQSTQLSRSIATRLGPHMPIGCSTAISPHLIYDNPSVDKLSSTLFAMFNPVLSTNGNQPEDADQMAFKNIQELVEKYSSDMPQNVQVDRLTHEAPKKLHIAVTGTTGFLGYYLLSTLLDDPKVGHITCLNRSAMAEEKFLSARSTYSPNSSVDQSKLEFLQISVGQASFGLSTEKFYELIASVDALIHNAWQVDFNQSLSSFENPHLIGVRTLIDWSLHSPRNMHIFFVSSVSTVAHWPCFHPSTTDPGIRGNIEERPPNANSSCPSGACNAYVSERPPTLARIPGKQFGYAQSKYTAELLFADAAATHGIRATILRPGEICNARAMPGPLGSRNDWLALLLRTSKSMGILPTAVTNRDSIDFMPVDQLAAIVKDIIHESCKTPLNESITLEVFNLVNPCTIPFAGLIPVIEHHFAKGGVDSIKVVSLLEWTEILKQKAMIESNENAIERYPALKIGSFFERLASDFVTKGTGIETTNGCHVSRIMREMRPIDTVDISAWLRDWQV